MNATKHTHEHAARYGAKANALLGAGQLVLGLFSGNYGFLAESGHQAADAVSLQAKANAMKADCHPVRARRLRKLAASVLLIGGAMGIGGGLKHIHDGTKEESNRPEVAGAIIGAIVNTAIARKTHGAENDHEDEAHDHETAKDLTLHVATDMGTGWLYAGALLAEPKIPGITNIALLVNGTVIGGAGAHTMHRIKHGDHVDH